MIVVDINKSMFYTTVQIEKERRITLSASPFGSLASAMTGRSQECTRIKLVSIYWFSRFVEATETVIDSLNA